MPPTPSMTARITRSTLLLVALAVASTPAQAQRSGESRGFNLLALPDLAATGMRPSSNFRFFVSNAGPMDVQGNFTGISPASRRATATAAFISQFNEITLYASAAPGDWRRNSVLAPSLSDVKGNGAALSFNYHFAPPGISHWLPADGSLGFNHNSARSTPSTDASCLNHTASGIPAGVTLMAGSDCPQTWGIRGWEGRRPIPQTSYETIFNANKANFRFNFDEVPAALTDTFSFLGDRFATYGVINDFSRERRKVFGKLIPGGTGEPSEEGYPMGLEWKFDAFVFNALPGTVFWQATVTNRTRQLYGVPLDYDSLFVGTLARHGRGVRARAGFDIARGTAVFNENGHNNTCDNAKATPGVFSFGAYTGNCPSVSGFGSGASAIVFLKSPIGDLRYKLFNDPNSRFHNPTSPVLGDTITFNLGRLCGDDCIQERFAKASTGYGVLASREALALGGDSPSSIEPFQYWQLFHPVNGAPYGLGPRVNPADPRAGGGFNWFVPTNWRYSTRPSSAPATGGDTIWFDTCNPILNACVPHWRDTLPDRSINFTRNATWVGTGPFRLAADSSASMVLGIIAAADSTTVERFINETIALYQGFFVAPAPPPAPRVVSARVIGGPIRLTGIRILLDNRSVGHTDPFLIQMAERYRTAAATTVEGRLQRVNRLGPLNRTIADTLTILASRNVSQILVYKSCDGGKNFTTSNSPNLCTRDVVRDTLGVERGPAAYRTMSPDSSNFNDGNVLSGQTYYYAFVPVSRGVRLQLRDSVSTTSQRVFDTLLVAPTSSIPSVASAPNVAVVYVPASQQAGSTPSRVRITRETGPSTIDSVPGAAVPETWNGLVVSTLDTIPTEQRYRVVIGDTVIVHRYTRTGLLDSTVVIARRSVVTGYTAAPTGAKTVTNAYALPKRVRVDTLRFFSSKPSGVAIVAAAPSAPVSAPVTLPGGTVRTTTTVLGGSCVTVPFATATVLTPVGVAVIISETESGLPLIVSSNLCGTAGGTTLNATVLRSPEYRDINVDIINRPVVLNTGATVGGATLVETFIVKPGRGRSITASLADRPAVNWQSGVTRMIGTNFGEYVLTFAGPEFGPIAPFQVTKGFGAVQADFNASLQGRAIAQRTKRDTAIVNAINTTLGTAYTVDSLLDVTLPFTMVNKSNGNREVLVAMRRSDKFASIALGSGTDTVRIQLPPEHWIPGEPLILLERTTVAQETGGVLQRDASGNLVMKDSLAVLATRAMINCSAVATPSCNPTIGRGGTGHVSFDPNEELHVRYAVPYTSDREFAFTVSPTIAGTRITSVTRAQLDSVRVVPNPYILYSNFESSNTNEQRVMFTHLPPNGQIRIYTVTGQFVQQLTWTAADLRGNGDLYYNLTTREGTLLASGLYLFTVTANTGATATKREQVGRFIVIR